MGKLSSNRLRERREACGLSQVELAGRARLSRQSVGSVETGRSIPAVDVALRLATALGCTVEDLFRSPQGDTTLVAVPASQLVTSRVALAEIGGRWVAYPLAGNAVATPADGLVSRTVRGRSRVDTLRAKAGLRENVALMGCAPALGLLAARSSSAPLPARYIWISSSSTSALEALRRGRTHLAGVHLVDARTGESNVADVRRHAGPEALSLWTLARWQAGFVTAVGNPLRIRRAADLGRRRIRLVVREEGSGAQRLLDRELVQAGISRALLRSPAVSASGHLEVAQMIAAGAADVGVATHDAALAFGLTFVPLAEERYDLALPRSVIGEPRIERLFDVLTSGAFRRELSALGYDTRASGALVAEIPAA